MWRSATTFEKSAQAVYSFDFGVENVKYNILAVRLKVGPQRECGCSDAFGGKISICIFFAFLHFTRNIQLVTGQFYMQNLLDINRAHIVQAYNLVMNRLSTVARQDFSFGRPPPRSWISLQTFFYRF